MMDCTYKTWKSIKYFHWRIKLHRDSITFEIDNNMVIYTKTLHLKPQGMYKTKLFLKLTFQQHQQQVSSQAIRSIWFERRGQAKAGARQHSPGLPQVNPSILTFGLAPTPTEEPHIGVLLSSLPAGFMSGELRMEEAEDSACMTNWASFIIGLLARTGGEPQKNPSLSKSSCRQIILYIYIK